VRLAWVVKGGGEVEPGEHSEAAQLAHPHVARTCVRLSVSRTTSDQRRGTTQLNPALHAPLSAATRTTPPHTTILVRVVHTRGTLGTRGGAPQTLPRGVRVMWRGEGYAHRRSCVRRVEYCGGSMGR
jgi:hypothetical protein